MSITSIELAETGDRPSEQIARRVRGLMGENQISGRRLAAAMHMDHNAFSRRYRGQVAWSTDELGTLAQLLKVPFGELCAIRDSNPEPADSKPRGRLLSLIGRTPKSQHLLPVASTHETPRRHLALVGGAA